MWRAGAEGLGLLGRRRRLTVLLLAVGRILGRLGRAIWRRGPIAILLLRTRRWHLDQA